MLCLLLFLVEVMDRVLMLLEHACKLYQDHLVNLGRRPNTIKTTLFELDFWRRFLEQEMNGPVYVSDLTPSCIYNFLLWLKQERGLKDSSRARYCSGIKGFLKFAHQRKLLSYDLVDCIPKIHHSTPERDYLTFEQVQQLAVNVKSDMVRVAVWLMYYGGLRVSEVVNLKPEDLSLDGDKKWMVIRNNKGGKTRRVPVSLKLDAILRDYLSWRKAGVYLLVGRSNKPLSTVVISAEVRRVRRVLGWSESITPHTLRHSFASHIYQKTKDMVVVSKLLGHSKLSTTQVYTHVNDDVLAQAVRVLECSVQYFTGGL